MLPVLYHNGPMGANALEAPANRLANLFDRFFNDDFFSPLTATPTIAAMPLSMWDDENQFYVEMDAPGLTEQDIDVSFHNGDLLISGERKCERKGNGYDTRSYGRFEQRISLPNWVKPDQCEAKLANGVLSLTFPKGEEAKPRKIPLKAK